MSADGAFRSAQTVETFAGGLIVAVDRDRTAVRFDRLGAVALLFVGHTKASPSVGVMGIDIERGVEVFNRRVIFADRNVTLAARLIGSASERIAIDRVIE